MAIFIFNLSKFWNIHLSCLEDCSRSKGTPKKAYMYCRNSQKKTPKNPKQGLIGALEIQTSIPWTGCKERLDRRQLLGKNPSARLQKYPRLLQQGRDRERMPRGPKELLFGVLFWWPCLDSRVFFLGLQTQVCENGLSKGIQWKDYLFWKPF